VALALELALGLLLHLYDGAAAAALLLGCLADGRRAKEGGLHGGDGAGYQLRRGGTSRSGSILCDRRRGIRWVGGRRGRCHGGAEAWRRRTEAGYGIQPQVATRVLCNGNFCSTAHNEKYSFTPFDGSIFLLKLELYYILIIN
jgi:hypothetical protein